MYDRGGGCSCGLYKVCNCEDHKEEKMEIGKKVEQTYDSNNAFGFSLMTEGEVKQKERELQAHLETVTTVADVTKQKLGNLHEAIMPLLSALGADSEKDYVYWPGSQRVSAIQAFVEKMEKLIAE
jgi:hypothetical protein